MLFVYDLPSGSMVEKPTGTCHVYVYLIDLCIFLNLCSGLTPPPPPPPHSSSSSLTDEFQVQVLSNTCADQLQLQGKYILKVTTSELALTYANGELPTRYTLCSQLVPSITS